MQINVTFRHIEPSVPLRAYVEEKISRVKKYLEEPIEAHVVLKVEKFRHIAEVTLETHGLKLNCTEETDNMYSSIDLLADTIDAQARKGREKGRRHKPVHTGKDFSGTADGAESFVSPDEEPRVIRTEQTYAKPMDVDEAVMQLKISNSEFMVFINRHTNDINVLYRRRDGHFGLIETST